MSAALGFGVTHQERLDNPARGIRKYPGKKMQRFLSPAELARLGQVLAAATSLGVESPFALAAIRLLMLTGCRKNEILTLKRSHIDRYHRCLIEEPRMIETDRFQKVEITSLDDLHDWLAANHAREESVWLVRWKRGQHGNIVDRLAVLDELLCWGWIDGLARKLDADRTMQLITPRRQQAWAQSYKDRAARLEREGRMQPPGRAAIESSKRLGLWDAYADVDALAVPDDLREVLRAAPPAEAFFDTAAPSYRRNVLRWLGAAKRPETRTKRLLAIVEASAAKRKLPQM